MKIIKNFIYINFVFFLFLSTNKLYSIEPPSKLVIKDLNREANNLETTKRLDKIFYADICFLNMFHNDYL